MYLYSTSAAEVSNTECHFLNFHAYGYSVHYGTSFEQDFNGGSEVYSIYFNGGRGGQIVAAVACVSARPPAHLVVTKNNTTSLAGQY